MYLVVFNKGKGSNYFGPFETEEEACNFVAEDTDDHKPYMQVERMISPENMEEPRARWKEIQELNRQLDDE